ncbi:MAG: AAA family ATPase, partial [Candidatus Xenobia bacterium]
MRFTRLQTSNVGLLGKRVDIPFATAGANLVVGGSESGKTTMVKAVHAVLQGLPRDQADALRTWGSEGPMFGRLWLQPDLRLDRDFTTNTATLKKSKEVLYQGTDQNELMARLEKATGIADLASTLSFFLEQRAVPAFSPVIKRLFTEGSSPEREAERQKLTEALDAARRAHNTISENMLKTGHLLDEVAEVVARFEAAAKELAAQEAVVAQREAEAGKWRRIKDGAERLKVLEPQKRKLDELKAEIEAARTELKTLTERIEGEYKEFASVPDDFASQLDQLEAATATLEKVRAKAEESSARAGDLKAKAEQLRADLEKEHGEYLKLDDEFPKNLSRFKDLEVDYEENKSEIDGLRQHLVGLQEEMSSRFARFQGTPDDYEAKLDALNVVAAEVPDLEKALEKAAAMKEQVAKLEGELASAGADFSGLPEDFPDKLQELGRVRAELAAKQKELQDIRARMDEIKTSIKQKHARESAFPQDFEERFKALQAEHKQLLARLAELEAGSKKRESLAQEIADVERELASYEGIHEQGADFLNRLKALHDGWKELEAVTAEGESMQAEAGATRTRIDSEFKVFVGTPDDYVQQVDKLKARLAVVEPRQEELKNQLSRHQIVEDELKTLQEKINQEHAEFADVPDDFGEKAQEYYKLHESSEKLKAQVAELRGRIAELERKVKSNFSAFMGGNPNLQATLKQHRELDVMRARRLQRLEWEKEQRDKDETRAREIEQQIQDLAGYQDLPANFPVLFAEYQAHKADWDNLSKMREENTEKVARVERELDEKFADQRNAPAELVSRLEACKSLRDQYQVQARMADEISTRVVAAKRQLDEVTQKLTQEFPDVKLEEAQLYLGRLIALRERLDEIGKIETQVEAMKDSKKSKSFFGGGKAQAEVEAAALKEKLHYLESSVQAIRKEWRIPDTWSNQAKNDVHNLRHRTNTFQELIGKRSTLLARVEALESLSGLANPEKLQSELNAQVMFLGLESPHALDDLIEKIRLSRTLEENLASLRLKLLQADLALTHLEKLREQLGPIADTSLPEAAVERFNTYRRLNEERIVVRGRLEVLRAPFELEQERKDLLEAVIKETQGLALTGTFKDATERAQQYLEYQIVAEELDRLQAERNQLLAADESGDELGRLTEKLHELETAFGKILKSGSLEDILKRYKLFCEIKADMELLRQDVCDLPSAQDIQAELDKLQQEMAAERERLRLPESGPSDEHMRRYAAYRELEEACKRQREAWRSKLHVEEVDGKQVTDVERIGARLEELAQKLGPWAKSAKNEKTLQETQRKLEEAQEFERALAEQKKSLEEMATEEAARFEGNKLQDAFRKKCAALNVTEGEVADGSVLEAWKAYNKVTSELELAVMMEKGVLGADGSSLTALEKKAETLASGLGSFGETSDHESVLQRFQDYINKKGEISRLQDEMAKERPASSIEEALEAARNEVKSLRKALHLNANDNTDTVRTQYGEYKDLLDEKARFDKKLAKAEQRKGDEGTTVLERLEREMAELLPRLGGREKVQDVDAELARFHKAQEARKACEAAEQAWKEASSDPALIQSLNEAEEASEKLLSTLGEWTKERKPAELREQYKACQEARERAKTLEQKLQEQPPLEEVTSELQEVEKEMADLAGAAPSPEESEKAAVRLQDVEEQLQADKATLDSLHERLKLAEKEKTGREQAIGTHDTLKERMAELQAQLGTAESDMAARQEALNSYEAAEQKRREGYKERCFERVSGILEKVTGGRYRKFWLDEENKPWLAPAKGPNISWEQAGSAQSQVSLWWQITVCMELGSTLPWPVVIDQPFEKMDAARRERAWEVLQEVAASRQLILFTSEQVEGVAPVAVLEDIMAQADEAAELTDEDEGAPASEPVAEAEAAAAAPAADAAAGQDGANRGGIEQRRGKRAEKEFTVISRD